jgi:hypothetical protein
VNARVTACANYLDHLPLRIDAPELLATVRKKISWR